MMALCENLQRSARSSSNPRALFDASMVRLALAEKMADVTALLSGQPVVAGKKKAIGREPTATSKPRAADRTPSGPAAPSRAVDDSSEPRAAAEAADPDAVWSRVLAAVADKASLGWVGSLRLSRFDGDSAHLTTVPGRRELLRFVTPQRSEQLAQLFRQVLGRPIRVDVGVSTGDGAESDGAARVGSDPSGSGASSDRDTVQRGRALELPLVRQVMEHFDASVVAAHRKPAAGTDAPAVDGDRSTDDKGNEHG
jgi:hypothetical protein